MQEAPEMTRDVSRVYNIRYVAIRRQTVRLFRLIGKESGSHEAKYAQNPHDSYGEFAQTRAFATDVRGPGPR
jgi:hypothetical protein